MAQSAISKLSVDHLMDAPLQQLIDELGITYKDAPITDEAFSGYAWVDKSGVVLAMPTGRSELEHECMARYLIGQAFRVDGLPELPDMFAVVDVTAPSRDFQKQLNQADEALRQVRAGGAA
ncbi:hypothetical protein [Streptomyces sp. NBC_01092]|uniref:hypothetical protein n=1 Tax=Streptomyces sp. NBC_01092 TaxID=2903748 RepID=UPI00386E918A|nr:hypothetical protein OG254_12365 [Streptomyces sp. NBC_01092]